MKTFFKILVAFLILFCLGLFITYLSIHNTFKKVEKEHLVTSFSNSILSKTYQVG